MHIGMLDLIRKSIPGNKIMNYQQILEYLLHHLFLVVREVQHHQVAQGLPVALQVQDFLKFWNSENDCHAITFFSVQCLKFIDKKFL